MRFIAVTFKNTKLFYFLNLDLFNIHARNEKENFIEFDKGTSRIEKMALKKKKKKGSHIDQQIEQNQENWDKKKSNQKLTDLPRSTREKNQLQQTKQHKSDKILIHLIPSRQS